MTLAELIPIIKNLSRTEKLDLMKVLVHEIFKDEAIHDDDEEADDDFTLEERIDFLKKPIAERNRIMEEQAEAMRPYYEQNTEWKDWPVEDIVEY